MDTSPEPIKSNSTEESLPIRVKRQNKQALVGVIGEAQEESTIHGARILGEQDPWSQNAWDQVEWG